MRADVHQRVRRVVDGVHEGERARRRAPGAQARATSLMVPSAFDAAPIASSRVRARQRALERRPVELAGLGHAAARLRTVTPRSRASARQGATLA